MAVSPPNSLGFLISQYLFIFQGGKQSAVLGVIDSKLSASINESCDIKCSHIGVVPEVCLFHYILFSYNCL